MAHIVPFRTAAARGVAETGRTPGAEIVIFPGVRRERHPEPAAAQPDGGSPRRDWLELLDELPTACP